MQQLRIHRIVKQVAEYAFDMIQVLDGFEQRRYPYVTVTPITIKTGKKDCMNRFIPTNVGNMKLENDELRTFNIPISC